MLTDSGKPQEALPIALAVLEARMRVLGADHPQTLRARLNLSSLYARLGRFDRTLAMQQEVIDARMRLLGPRHPDTIYILVNRAGSLHQAGRSKESLAMLDTVLPLAREVLGDGHPQTQAAMQIRADAADALGDQALVVASYRELLAARDESLGAKDRKTIDTAWQLEGVLNAAGQREEAAGLRARYVAPLLATPDAKLEEGMREFAAEIRRTEAEEASEAANITAKH
jgi:non-specific serine/threonine protein kinase/serine/threonine-protein kinase